MAGLLDVGNNVVNASGNLISDYFARRWQEKMWDRQNEYNLPVNQRKRLEDAGINPNLAFGSSASAMGTSVPSSPATHPVHSNLGEFSLRARQIKAEIEQQNANTRRMDEETQRLELANVVFDSLLQDTIETRRGEMYIDRLMQAWTEDHGKEKWDAELSGLQLHNDLLTVQKLYDQARTLHTQASYNRLLQEYEHLRNKYQFEDYYYLDHQNPYETSTAMGFFRMLMGTIGNFLDIDPYDISTPLPVKADQDFVNRLKRRHKKLEGGVE